MGLPHVQNSKAAREHFEPVVNSLFRVTFILPTSIKGEPLLTEHVISVTGFKDPGPEAVQQQYGTAIRSYASTEVNNTQVLDFTMSLNLNKNQQNYVLKKIKEWRKMVFNPLTAEYGLAADYMGQIVVERYNKKFQTIYERTIHNAWPSGELTGIDDYDITNHEPMQLSFQVTGDYYSEAEL